MQRVGITANDLLVSVKEKIPFCNRRTIVKICVNFYSIDPI